MPLKLMQTFEPTKLDTCNEFTNDKRTIFCDASYGLPNEKKPRKEKVCSIARQIVNFLNWQGESDLNFADIVIVGCTEAAKSELQQRIQFLLKGDLPSHIKFLDTPLYTTSVRYLSPDADEVLDPNLEPPQSVVVGLLIDRKIQPNRSKNQAAILGVKSARFALESFNVNCNEPLNVDTVLIGMQRWWWNCEFGELTRKESFFEAIEHAMSEHVRRHPNRPLHLTSQNTATAND
jgi:hypothetical protein